MTLTSHQRPVRGATSEWLTPPEWIQALGPFDLDPCSPISRPWDTAAWHYTLTEDGLTQEWEGFVWLNPPFGPEAAIWLERLAAHDNGVALVAARTETRWFQRWVWGCAAEVLFVASRPHFHYPNGVRAPFNSGVPIVLIAYGAQGAKRLRDCGIAGALVTKWDRPTSGATDQGDAPEAHR